MAARRNSFARHIIAYNPVKVWEPLFHRVVARNKRTRHLKRRRTMSGQQQTNCLLQLPPASDAVPLPTEASSTSRAPGDSRQRTTRGPARPAGDSEDNADSRDDATVSDPENPGRNRLPKPSRKRRRKPPSPSQSIFRNVTKDESGVDAEGADQPSPSQAPAIAAVSRADHVAQEAGQEEAILCVLKNTDWMGAWRAPLLRASLTLRRHSARPQPPYTAMFGRRWHRRSWHRARHGRTGHARSRTSSKGEEGALQWL